MGRRTDVHWINQRGSFDAARRAQLLTAAIRKRHFHPFERRSKEGSKRVILVDSSVWIDFFRGHETAAVDQLAKLLNEAAAPIAIADLALFEVLRGFRHQRDYVAADRVMRALDVVLIGGDAICRAAAQHYRELRSRGVTIASPIDVLQATYCIEHNHALLHSDSDFDAMESLRGLKVWRH